MLSVFEYPSIEPTSPAHRSRVHAFRASLDNENWSEGTAETKSIIQQVGTQLCFDGCKDCDHEWTANLVHSACLLLLMRPGTEAKHRLPISARLLARAARALRPLVLCRTGQNFFKLDAEPCRFRLPDDTSRSKDLGPLLADIERKLPRELRDNIYGRLTGSFFLSLCRCLGTLQSLPWPQLIKVGDAPRLSSQSPLLHHHPPSLPERLFATTVDVLGETCLASLQITGLYTAGLAVDIRDSPIQGVEYAFGIYGVTGLRILYHDGSTSSWLGEGRRLWVTKVRGDSISKLRTVSDVSVVKLSSHQSTFHSWTESHPHFIGFQDGFSRNR